MKNPMCPRCGDLDTRRLKREGFLQIKVFPLFRLYPWECMTCRFPFHTKNRGRPKHRRSSSNEPQAPLTP